MRTDSFREGKALETKKQSATGRGKDTRNHDKAKHIAAVGLGFGINFVFLFFWVECVVVFGLEFTLASDKGANGHVSGAGNGARGAGGRTAAAGGGGGGGAAAGGVVVVVVVAVLAVVVVAGGGAAAGGVVVAAVVAVLFLLLKLLFCC